VILGRVRDGFPRVTFEFVGREEPVLVELVLDTGFDGDIALPPLILSKVAAEFQGERTVLMADRTPRRTAYYDVMVEWDGEHRTIEAMMVDGRPLLGNDALRGTSINIEMVDGGEVSIEVM
jgi:clan AA aspartic protease